MNNLPPLPSAIAEYGDTVRTKFVRACLLAILASDRHNDGIRRGHRLAIASGILINQIQMVLQKHAPPFSGPVANVEQLVYRYATDMMLVGPRHGESDE